MLTDNLANHVDEHKLGQVECCLAAFSAENRKISLAFLQAIGSYHKLVATEVIRTTVSVVVEMNCDYSVEHSNHRIFPIFPNRFNYSYREK